MDNNLFFVYTVFFKDVLCAFVCIHYSSAAIRKDRSECLYIACSDFGYLMGKKQKHNQELHFTRYIETAML